MAAYIKFDGVGREAKTRTREVERLDQVLSKSFTSQVPVPPVQLVVVVRSCGRHPVLQAAGQVQPQDR